MDDLNAVDGARNGVHHGLPPILLPAVLLTVADVVLTFAWIERGIAVEGNPLVARLIDALGPALGLGIRGAIGVSLLLVLGALAHRSRLARAALPTLTAVLAGVFVWHVAGAATMLL